MNATATKTYDPETYPAIYRELAQIDIDKVPAYPMISRSGTTRKELAALIRKLFKTLGLHGLSVRTERGSFCVHIYTPRIEYDYEGFRQQYDREPVHFLPEDSPPQVHNKMHEKLEAILNKAFPNHQDRSDSMTDYFDFEWMIG